jgi:hypothetical protein
MGLLELLMDFGSGALAMPVLVRNDLGTVRP